MEHDGAPQTTEGNRPREYLGARVGSGVRLRAGTLGTETVSPPHMDVWADQVARGIGGGGGDMECVDVGTGRGNGLGAMFRM